jgi:hypothetical protein
MFKDTDIDDIFIYNKIAEMIQNFFTPNIFASYFINNGGVVPNATIRQLLTDVGTHFKGKALTHHLFTESFYKIFFKYLHNRIGTSLTSSELQIFDYTNAISVTDDYTGKVIVESNNANNGTFVLLVDHNVSRNSTIIKNLKNPATNVNTSSLKIYPETIPQTMSTTDISYLDTDLLETYIVN